MNEDELTQRAKSGAIWLTCGRFASRGASIAAIVILARKLEPAAFGVVAIAEIFWNFLQGLSTQGVSSSIIHEKDEHKGNFDQFIAASLTLQCLFAIPVVGLGILLAPWLSRFFGFPQLVSIVVAMALLYLVTVVEAIPNALMRKDIKFGLLTAKNFIVAILISGSSVLLALLNFGVWSLVLPRIFIKPLEMIFSFYIIKLRPRLCFDFAQWKRIFRFARNVSISYVLDFSNRNLDKLILGKMLGQSALGIYSVASNWSIWFVRNVVFSVGNVMFPLLSKVRENTERTRAILLVSVRRLFLVSSPVLIGLFLIAPEFVRVVYGQKWEGAILPFRILLLHAWRKSITSPINSVPLAYGRPDLLAKVDMFFFPVYPAVFWIGAKFYGIPGMALALLVSQLVMVLVKVRISFRMISLKFQSVFLELRGLLLSVVGMSLVVSMVRNLLNQANELSLLLIAIGSGAVSYAVFMLIFSREDIKWVINQFISGLGNVRSILKLSFSASRQT
jgi:lipopolysaccharide exporter